MNAGDPFDWRHATPEEVDLEYSPSRHAMRPLDEYLAEYREMSTGVDAASMRTPGRPLLIYIHGGYWQRLSAADSLFNAADAVAENVSLHAVDYTLAPRATVGAIVEECRAEVLAVLEELSPERVVLSGCSAGAHLTAMCALDPLISARLDAVVLLSGIYDLRPLVVTPTNDPLGLDEDAATGLSPLLLQPPRVREALCAVGDHESGEFIRQNGEYARHLADDGTPTMCEVVRERDHFNLPYDLLRRGTTVGDWTLSRLGRG